MMIKSRRMRWAGHVAQIGETNAHNISIGIPEGNRPLGTRRRSMDCRDIRCECVDWINLAQDRNQWRGLVNMAMNHWVS